MGLFTNDASDDVIVSASFPESNPFGWVVNGERNGLNIHLNNVGSKNYTLVSASASFHNTQNYWSTVKNATTLKYGVPLTPGSNFSAPFTLHSEFRPQELGLTVWVNLAEQGSSDIHHLTALNQRVTISEPVGGYFDLQLIFLYLVLGTALAGASYLIYNSFFKPTPKRRGGKKEIKKKAVVPAESGKVYPDVKPYEEEWIPEQQLKSRQSKTKKSENAVGASSGGEGLTSAGEATSGGETSGAEGKARKRKGKKA